MMNKSNLFFSGLIILVIVALLYSLIPTTFNYKSKIYAYGKNSLGQLANYSVTGNFSEIKFQENIKSISAGFDHVLLLTENGDVFAWGDNNYGQVGIDSLKGVVSSPNKIENLKNIVMIAAGYRHSMAIDSTGNLYAWGNNIAGQLGNNSRIDSRSPTKIEMPDKVKSIAAGHRFSLAILENSKVYGWGASCENAPKKSFQELMQLIGQSATGISYYVDANADPSSSNNQELCEFQGFVPVSSLTPVEIPELVGSKKIVAGFGHLLALQENGTIKSKGCNAYGQLGYPTADLMPALTIEGLTNIVDIAVSTRHSLALNSSGEVLAWGANNSGELGVPSRTTDASIYPLKVENLPKIKLIAVGHDFSLAIDENGQLWSWGVNKDNQLPNINASDEVSTPTLSIKDSRNTIIAGGAFTLQL